MSEDLPEGASNRRKPASRTDSSGPACEIAPSDNSSQLVFGTRKTASRKSRATNKAAKTSESDSRATSAHETQEPASLEVTAQPPIPNLRCEHTGQISEELAQAEQSLHALKVQAAEVSRLLAQSEKKVEQLRRRATGIADLHHEEAALAEAERRLEKLRQQTSELTDHAGTSEILMEAEQRVETLQREAAALIETTRVSELFAEANERLEKLRKEANQITDLSRLAEALDSAERRMEKLQQIAAEIGNFNELDVTLSLAEGRIETCFAQVAEARRSVDELVNTIQSEVRDVTDEFSRTNESIRQAREEVGTLSGQVQQIRESLRETDHNASCLAETETSARTSNRDITPADTDVELPQYQSSEKWSFQPAQADELIENVSERVLHFLGEALAIEKEQVGLLQSLADATFDPEVRSLLQQHRTVTLEQQHAIVQHMGPLHEEQAHGRAMVGQVVTRIWDALQKPHKGDGSVESLLKALGIAETEVGIYLTLSNIARISGDQEVAELAASHLEQEQDFVRRLKNQLKSTAAHMVLRAESVSP